MHSRTLMVFFVTVFSLLFEEIQQNLLEEVNLLRMSGGCFMSMCFLVDLGKIFLDGREVCDRYLIWTQQRHLHST